VPAQNRTDIDNLTELVRKGLEIVFADSVIDCIGAVLKSQSSSALPDRIKRCNPAAKSTITTQL
jgi:hypothetical protein